EGNVAQRLSGAASWLKLAIRLRLCNNVPAVTKCFYCSSEIPRNSAVCPACGETVAAPSAGLETSLVTEPRHIKIPPLDRGRFVAGTLLGKRYRIIGLL